MDLLKFLTENQNDWSTVSYTEALQLIVRRNFENSKSDLFSCLCESMNVLKLNAAKVARAADFATNFA